MEVTKNAMIESQLSVQGSSLTGIGLFDQLGLVHTQIANDVAGPMTHIVDFGPADKIPWGTDAAGNFYWGWGPIEARQYAIPDAVANDTLAWEVPLPTDQPDAVFQTLAGSSEQMAGWMADAGITYNPFGFGNTFANSNETLFGLMEANEIAGFMPSVNIWGLGSVSEGVLEAASFLDPTFSVAGLMTFGPQIMSVFGDLFAFDVGFAANDNIGIIQESIRSVADPVLMAA